MGGTSDWNDFRMFDIPTTGKPRKRGFQSRSGNFKWRQSGGYVIDMRDMSYLHLLNAIKICQATGNNGKAEQLRIVLNERATEGKAE
ncbi:hypothetical protein [Nitratireductor basaltis]|uniref:Uncharacterized protein n=1 Tax=Nitratireductor basaltis TaxID=472175 RepID=A0A084UDP7_9HYPH|nr:hypothetical protein [Nitratireductor basaltis]KFB11083.1 hypothetical protein EL18_02125 [Nitratireductor basaltis]